MNSFTQQQMARMHCYIDLMYKNWLIDEEASQKFQIPIAPRIVPLHKRGNQSIIIVRQFFKTFDGKKISERLSALNFLFFITKLKRSLKIS